MPKRFNETITSGDRAAANLGCRDLDADTPDIESLARYFHYRPATIRRWLSGGTVGVMRLTTVGKTLSAMCYSGFADQNPGATTSEDDAVSDDEPRDRAILALLAGFPGGVYRIPLYNGYDRVYNEDCETLGLALRWASSYLTGGLDNDIGYRWSLAWHLIYIEPLGGGWRVHIEYSDMAAGDKYESKEKEPEEP